MTFDSSNREALEGMETAKVIETVRTAMGEGCIHPSHVFDAVDELICRVVKANEELASMRSTWFTPETGKAMIGDLADKVKEIDRLNSEVAALKSIVNIAEPAN